MQHRRPPLPVIVLVILVLAAGIYYGVRMLNADSNGALGASGTIEATAVNISPEMAGKVKEVFAGEGQPVKSGAALLALDDSLLSAQKKVAQSAVESARSALLTAQRSYDMAQAQYDATLTAARAQEGKQRLADWAGKEPGQFDEPLWYFSREEQMASAQSQIDAAQVALQQAQSDYDAIVKKLDNAEFVAAETRVSDARVGYLIAKAVRDKAQMTGGKVRPEDVQVDIPWYAPSAYRIKIDIAKKLSGDSDVLTAAEDTLDDAEAELEDAQNTYASLLNTDAAKEVKEARATLSVEQERYHTAMDALSQMQTGEYSPQVTIAAAALEQAKAGLEQANNGVQQADANLSLLDTQIEKLKVYSPQDGVILTRNVEPGEFVQPGATAFAVANLDDMTITVYVPEDRYGEIKLGQQATVTVDSYPGETFSAEVIHIADQAEFTPRNVQTVEGRSATVYAIKLKVADDQGRLKIGMPADVVFER
jgi:multidrug resistance efflux pump